MRALLFAAVMVGLAGSAPEFVEAQYYYSAERYVPTGPNSYVYDRSWGRVTTPYYGYGYAPRYHAYGYVAPRTGYYRPLAPYGFGSRYYSGYNDPYYDSYGPGVREFLDFGGADFYGW